jgi:putative ABC transport system permease protein
VVPTGGVVGVGGGSPSDGSGSPIGGSGSPIGGNDAPAEGRFACAAATAGNAAMRMTADNVFRISYDYTPTPGIRVQGSGFRVVLVDFEMIPRAFGRTFSVLDVKLGVRMLVKSPGLTLVGVLALSVAIAIGAGTFTFFYAYMNPPLPLDEGERIVGIENWDAEGNRREERTLHDFAIWRDELKSIEDVGAYREIRRNVLTDDGVSERVRVAEMTASGFRLARVSPLAGRAFVDEDERKGAPHVIVIGAEVWRTRFTSDPDVIGKTVRLGNTLHTIVGIMPDGFAFPVYHSFWIPLQASPDDYDRRQGPAINVFGRLAPGAGHESAQAELSTIGLRAAGMFPETNARLRPRLAPYPSLWFGDDMVAWYLHVFQFLITLILVVVSVNVASLVYARTAMRHGEIVVRSALGGSRRRIVMQLFVEALVLSSISAAIGLLIADRALIVTRSFLEQFGGVPFWMGHGLSVGAVIYAGGLAVLGAAIVGAVPALKATGRRLEPGLRQLSGATGLRLGKTWTVLIVSQVALVVAVMPATVSTGWQAIRYRAFDAAMRADEYLTARVSMDADTPATADAEAYQRTFATRFGQRMADVVRQLEAEATVAGVAFTSSLPGNEPTTRLEAEGVASPPATIRFALVSPGFFDVFQIPLLAGRPFAASDLNTVAARTLRATVPTVSGRVQEAVVPGNSAGGLGVRSSAVIVNRTFAQRVLGGGSLTGLEVSGVLGRRIKYVGAPSQPDAWYEIVGVVPDFPAGGTELTSVDARVYHPVTFGEIYPASVVARVRGASPANLSGRLRDIATAADPALQLAAVMPLDLVYREGQQAVRLVAITFGIVTVSILLLAAAGIYALMSFTIAQRQREIGVRVALGADPRRLLAGIFSRAFLQVSAGVVVGFVLSLGLFEDFSNTRVTSSHGVMVMSAVAMVMLVVGLLAALGPARRGLRIDPTEALRGEN